MKNRRKIGLNEGINLILLIVEVTLETSKQFKQCFLHCDGKGGIFLRITEFC